MKGLITLLIVFLAANLLVLGSRAVDLAKVDRLLEQTRDERTRANFAWGEAARLRDECRGPFETEELILTAPPPLSESGIGSAGGMTRYASVFVDSKVPVYLMHRDGSREKIWPKGVE